ncbi:MAG: NAD(P)/FAD-dependent oxidoreductase, partial [Dehalococcoidia bacterium]
KPSSVILRNIALRLEELLPGVEDQRVLRAWAGIVEVTPDGEPIIDMLDYPQGFVLVDQSGHGFAPCPATGVAVRDLIIKGKCSFDISAFKLSRFEGFPKSWRQSWGWQAGAYTN